MNAKQTKTIADPESIISEIYQKPIEERRSLESNKMKYEQDLKSEDIEKSILAELLLERVNHRIEDFQRWSIEQRQRSLSDAWIRENAPSLVETLSSKLSDKLAEKPGFLASIGKKVSELSAAMFAPNADRFEIESRRAKAEEAAAAVEADIVAANHEIRRLEVEPSLESFRRADAAVNRVQLNFP